MLNSSSNYSQRFSWSACPRCNFVSDSMGLSNPKALCPKCKQPGVRGLFPDPSHLYLLDMIVYFQERAGERTKDLPVELVQDIQRQIGGSYTPKQLTTAAQDIQQFLNRARTTQRTPDVSAVVERIRKHLNLSSSAAAQQVWTTLALYSQTVEEHKVIPILSATLLEAMLDSLLKCIGSTKANDDQNYKEIVDRIERLTSFEARRDYFKELTAGASLKSAIEATQFANFYTDWNTMRQERNNFVHGFPFAIGASIAGTAFQLATDAPHLFAELQNGFAIRALSGPIT